MRLALTRSTLVLVAALLGLLSVVASPTGAEAAHRGDVRFTKGPGNGAPPATLHGVPVTPFPADSRPMHTMVSDIGPLRLSRPVEHLHVDESWETWTNAYYGDVYLTTGVTITLPKRTAAFYFYAEPNNHDLKIRATTDDGTTGRLTVDQTDDGDAKFFGFYSTKPLTSFVKSVTISASEEFAFGELGIGYGFSPYAALGDSYSSGEGTGVYDPATDTAGDRCHRSPDAYSGLIARADRARRPLTFAACSGATTSDLSHPNHLYAAEPAQHDALSPLNRKVSLTIGGNDLGFADVLGACLRLPAHDGRGCSKDPRLTALVNGRLATLAGSAPTPVPGPDGSAITPVAAVLADLHARAPKARIFVGAYPELFGDDPADLTPDATAPSGASCVVNSSVGASLDGADVRWFNDRTRALNAVLKAGVKAAERSDRSLEATFVSASTFSGHGLCDAHQAWINPLVLARALPPGVAPESFHPTKKGQRDGYAKAFHRAGL